MRFPYRTAVILVVAAACFWSDAKADDDAQRRARAAIALSAPPPRVSADSECGLCKTDVNAVRKVALDTGKVMVLFVGGCEGRAKDLLGTGSVFARVDEYKADKCADPKAKRMIVVSRDGPDGEDLLIRCTLPCETPIEKVKEKVKEARDLANPKGSAKKLDWFASADVPEERIPPVKPPLPTQARYPTYGEAVRALPKAGGFVVCFWGCDPVPVPGASVARMAKFSPPYAAPTVTVSTEVNCEHKGYELRGGDITAEKIVERIAQLKLDQLSSVALGHDPPPGYPLPSICPCGFQCCGTYVCGVCRCGAARPAPQGPVSFQPQFQVQQC
jgi:hypothetical protein